MGGRAEPELVAALQAGDERAFAEVVSAHHAALLRVASAFVPTKAMAEDVVQDTWLAVVRGIARFEGRSSLRTWLVSIVVNRAKSAGQREHRTIPIDALAEAADIGGPFAADGHWLNPPESWTEAVEDRFDAQRATELLSGFLADLPDGQRQVLVLRDVDGLSSREVCDLLAISEANQRVLLHRARIQMRARLVGAER